ncbi:peptide/nickel transport system permease protein [Salirhabdus euzebyi]|uniref:Peptide/nickel transport system permease protein n=1 Tax=Salirhabdus euzebyi TaxID=394506 RepID=A0A841Q6C4_9BACI|nr:ABC transporter permease subunit [Salirhabdus euzebyi]MBB6453903.1 peptide/nickel transport system permease protein [Salirhabdus euzebyi]
MQFTRLLKIGAYYVLGILGIICISVMPQAFQTNGFFNIFGYFSDLFKFLFEFINPKNWVFMYKEHPQPVIEFLWEPFKYSMTIIVGAILLGFFIAAIMAFLANFLPRIMYSFLKKILDFLESIPEVVIALLLQLLVIYIYKATGTRVFGIAALGSEQKIYLAPIITLAILPMISLFKILLLMIEEEMLKDYVEFAKSKGLREKSIILFHVIKNITPSAFYHSKVIVWALLSSLFIIEYIFNIQALTHYITLDFQPMTIAFGLIMLFTPFFLFYQLIDYWISTDERDAFAISKEIKDKKESKWLRYIWIPFVKGSKVLFVHMKNVKFAIGFLFLFGLTTYSFIYSILTDSKIDRVKFLYDEKGSIASGPPHAPPNPMLLGSDDVGYSMFDQIIVGAKYTLFFAFLIAFLRVFIGFIGGIYYAFKMDQSRQKWVEKLVDAMHFLPLSIIAYLLLRPVLWGNPDGTWEYSLFERISIEVFLLTILVVPMTMVLTGNEMKQVLKSEFILSARVLGGSPLHILRRHVLPHIGARMTILFGQQFIQTLLIFIHLGIFQLFFGGTVVTMGWDADPPKTFTYEWSGLIGNTRTVIFTGNYWILGTVLLAFMLSIFAMQLIIQGVKEVQQVKVGVTFRKMKRKRVKQKKELSPSAYTYTQESFTPIKKMSDV